MSGTVTIERSGGLVAALRRRRVAVAAVLLVLAAVALTAVVGTAEEGNSVPLDPGNAGVDGTRAVARVLDDEGVDVEVVRSADDLDAALGDETDERTGVVVTRADQLGTSTTDRLLDAVGERRLVVVQAGPSVLADLGVEARPTSVDPGASVGADCGGDGLDPLVGDLEVAVDDAEGYTRVEGGCFAVDGRPTVVTEGSTVLVGLGEALTNEQVLRGDNAALALRLLGQDDRLVWYVPTYDDLQPDDEVGTLGSFAPPWFEPAVWVLVATVVALMLWRGRRLGALAVEPLPVVVRASETTRSRGRLYRRADDRAHAAAGLRAASRRRARRRLRLGPADDVQLAEVVAQHTGRPPAEVAALLLDHTPPSTDRALVALAADLDRLDREVTDR